MFKLNAFPAVLIQHIAVRYSTISCSVDNIMHCTSCNVQPILYSIVHASEVECSDRPLPNTPLLYNAMLPSPVFFYNLSTPREVRPYPILSVSSINFSTLNCPSPLENHSSNFLRSAALSSPSFSPSQPP
jgi:hypothetical protein